MLRLTIRVLPLLLLVRLTSEGFAEPPGRPAVPAVAASSAVLVLHGGQVLQGQITRTGDLYRVVSPGSEIRIRAAAVAYECETLDDAYRRRRGAIRVDSADEHIELAQWCVRYGLLSAAARELADAMATDPDNPAIPYLERQLNASLAPLAAPLAGAGATRTAGPTRQELDQLVRRVPSGSVEAFTGTIQPLLVNSCATGGCHGPQSAGRLRLLRGRSGSPPSRRVTLANLHAVLACVDRERPEKSPLLVEAIRVHGTAAKPVLTSADEQKYRQIVAWVRSVSAVARAGEAGPAAGEAVQPAVANIAPAAPLSAGRPSAANAPNGPTTPSGPAGQASDSTVQRGAKTGSFVPADPFDPEIFNRQYHGEK